MYDMVNRAAEPLTQAKILETAGRYLFIASRTELARAVELDSRISLAEDALGPCTRGAVDEVPTFDLGFDLSAPTAAGNITGVEPDGPAFQAGLRNGQRLSRRLSVYNNQPVGPQSSPSLQATVASTNSNIIREANRSRQCNIIWTSKNTRQAPRDV